MFVLCTEGKMKKIVDDPLRDHLTQLCRLWETDVLQMDVDEGIANPFLRVTLYDCFRWYGSDITSMKMFTPQRRRMQKHFPIRSMQDILNTDRCLWSWKMERRGLPWSCITDLTMMNEDGSIEGSHELGVTEISDESFLDLAFNNEMRRQWKCAAFSPMYQKGGFDPNDSD